MAARKPKTKTIDKRSKLTEKNIAELESRFRQGATVLEAIDGIMGETTYYDHQKGNSEFAARMDFAREYITEVARGVVARRVMRGDASVAQWWLERRNKAQFSPRVEQTGADGEKLESVVIYRPEKLPDADIEA